MSIDDENKFKTLLIVGSIIGLLGAIALIVGIILQFNVFSATGVNVFGFVTVAIGLGIFFVCLVTLLGTLNLGFSVNDERPSFFALGLFIFAPTIIISDFTTPIYYLLEMGNRFLDTNTPNFAFYLTYISTGLILIAFGIHTWIFLWKNRLTFLTDQTATDNEIGLVKVIRIIASTLILLASAGIIIGMIVAPYNNILDPDVSSLIMVSDGSHIDLQAIFFIAEMFIVAVTAVIILFGNFGVFTNVDSEIPLLILLGMLIIVPGYVPRGNTVSFWTSPIYELLVFLRTIVGDSNLQFTAISWILLISLCLLIPAVFLGSISYFFGGSASGGLGSGPGIKTPKLKKTKKRKKGKLPTSPPSAQPEAGGLASQLQASSSGPPSAATGPPTGPPTGGVQPTVSSEPPSPPSFMPTSPPGGAQADAEKPTCPFCGKNLRFIDEYQRWYCDSCAQYV